MTVGERIKETRIKRGLTQEQLAERLGYKTKSAISKIEAAGDNLSLVVVTKVSKALHVPPSYIMGWMDEDKSIMKYTETPMIDDTGTLGDVIRRINEALKTMDEKGIESLAQYAEFLSRKGE